MTTSQSPAGQKPGKSPDPTAKSELGAGSTFTLRLFKVPVPGGIFNFSNSLEQVPYWQDWLIMDVEPDAQADTFRAYAAWGSLVPGGDLNPDPISQQLPPEEGGQDLTFTADGASIAAFVPLPSTAVQKGILGGEAKICIRVSPRQERAAT